MPPSGQKSPGRNGRAQYQANKRKFKLPFPGSPTSPAQEDTSPPGNEGSGNSRPHKHAREAVAHFSDHVPLPFPQPPTMAPTGTRERGTGGGTSNGRGGGSGGSTSGGGGRGGGSGGNGGEAAAVTTEPSIAAGTTAAAAAAFLDIDPNDPTLTMPDLIRHIKQLTLLVQQQQQQIEQLQQQQQGMREEVTAVVALHQEAQEANAMVPIMAFGPAGTGSDVIRRAAAAAIGCDTSHIGRVRPMGNHRLPPPGTPGSSCRQPAHAFTVEVPKRFQYEALDGAHRLAHLNYKNIYLGEHLEPAARKQRSLIVQHAAFRQKRKELLDKGKVIRWRNGLPFAQDKKGGELGEIDVREYVLPTHLT